MAKRRAKTRTNSEQRLFLLTKSQSEDPTFVSVLCPQTFFSCGGFSLCVCACQTFVIVPQELAGVPHFFHRAGRDWERVDFRHFPAALCLFAVLREGAKHKNENINTFQG